MSEAEVIATPLLCPAGGVPAIIGSENEFASAVKKLSELSGPIAVDAERASGYRYSARAYLIQIKRGKEIFLIDPIPFANSPLINELNQIIQSDEVILHASTQDLPCLREWGLTPKRLFDTELGARLTGLPRVGLGALVEHFFNLSLTKEHSAVDWSIRPLNPEWINYAALDVELLIELRNEIASLLEGDGKLAWAESEFQSILDAPPAPPREDPWRRTSGMHKVRKREQLAVVRELWIARDKIASALDVAPGRLLSDNAITQLAVAAPTTVKGFQKTLKPIGLRPRWMENVNTWVDAITRAPESELPPMRINGDGMPPVKQWREKFPERYAPLTHARDAVIKRALELNMPSENLITPEFVRRICWDQTQNKLTVVEEKLAKLGARPWQISEVAPLLTEALGQSEPLSEPESAPEV
ncbi:MAG: HRDC domain-containing protein [Candidatus Nanopelagicaceae bacterium]